jgi:hypothetical protein
MPTWDQTAQASDQWVAITFALKPKPASPPSCIVTTTLKHVRPSTTIAFHGSSQAAVGTGVTTITLPVPAGTADGDVMIAVLAVRPDTATVTAPGGWGAAISSTGNVGPTASRLLVYKRTASSEPASYAWTLGAGPTGAAGGIMSFGGADTAAVDVNNAVATATSFSHTTPSSSTSFIDEMLIATFEFPTAAPWSEASGMTEAIDIASEAYPNTAGISIASYYKLQPSVATFTKTATSEFQADAGVAHIVSLKPAVVGSSTVLGSGSAGFASATPTLTQIGPFGTSGVTFADGDRLHLEASVPGSSSCTARIHFDGATEQSKLLVATIVPEGILGLLLLAPVLPVAIKRRWILIPWLRVRDRRALPAGPPGRNGGPKFR